MRVEVASRSGLGSLRWAQSHCFGASPVHVVPLWLANWLAPTSALFSQKFGVAKTHSGVNSFASSLTHSPCLNGAAVDPPGLAGVTQIAPQTLRSGDQGLERRVEAERARRAEGQERPSNGLLPFWEQGGVVCGKVARA